MRELKEVDPFASSAPTGFVETERDRLIRLVRPAIPYCQPQTYGKAFQEIR